MKQLILLIILWVNYYNFLDAQIVFNEIYPDPDPSIGLPEAEFVELLNTSEIDISLLNWEFSDGSSSRIIQSDIIISPNEFIILCADEHEEAFAEFGRVALVASLPSLNNTGDELTLLTPEGEVSDYVSYERSWFNNPLKEDGGWSLERKNPNNTCDAEANWTASNSEFGGTPGQQNSIFDDSFQDESSLEILSVYYDNLLKIEFSKPIVINEDQFSIIPDLSLGDVRLENGNQTLVIEFINSLQENQIYEFRALDIRDCTDLSSINGTYPFGDSRPIELGEVLINEILFNPATGGVDFIEIINVTENLFRFDGLSILEINIDTNELIDYETIIDSKQYILPNQFYVLTSNPEVISDQYELVESKLVLDVNIPNYADEVGKIALVNEQTDTIDLLKYSEEWHAPTINRVDGVSLERISLFIPTQLQTNWYSASYLAGNATPTRENSQMGNLQNLMGEELRLSGKIFTPDGDGIDDFLVISFPGIQGQATATIRIFDTRGYLVRTLLNNQIIGTDNQTRWNGVSENGEVIPIGHYFIIAEIFDEDGNITRLREKVVVSRIR